MMVLAVLTVLAAAVRLSPALSARKSPSLYRISIKVDYLSIYKEIARRAGGLCQKRQKRQNLSTAEVC